MKREERYTLLLLFLLFSFAIRIGCQTLFDPPMNPISVKSRKVEPGVIDLDGFLNERIWPLAPSASGFIQREPNQGINASFDTDIRILYDDKSLWLGIRCFDPEALEKAVVGSMKRDFREDNDWVAVHIDPMLDKMTSYVFYVNPAGVQGDGIVIDDSRFDLDWNCVWKVKTSIDSVGWVAEIEIPWKSLRYRESPEETSIGINFSRCIRRINEESTWSPVPRAYGANKMSYAGILVLEDLPEPGFNLQIQPYSVISSIQNSTFKELHEERDLKNDIQFGADIKWAINQQTILDLTWNTDFAQAEVDQQVSNYERFSIFFPEKRQFFLENSSLFSPAFYTRTENMPFCSRRLGLDENGKPVQVSGGARLVSRAGKNSFGAMLLRQDETANVPAMNAGIFRASRYIIGTSEIGALITMKFSEEKGNESKYANYTATVDGTVRLGQSFQWNYLISKSATTGSHDNGNGFSGYSRLFLRNNQLTGWLVNTFISNYYNPELGVITRGNTFFNSAGFWLNLRPEWRSPSIRNFSPGGFTEAWFRASDGKFEEGLVLVRPVSVFMKSGATLTSDLTFNLQVLDMPFAPFGIQIDSGIYRYFQNMVQYTSDQARRVAVTMAWRTGNFYNGYMNRYRGIVSYRPVPQLKVSADYLFTRIADLGSDKVNKDISLIITDACLALGPRLILNTAFQWYSLSDFANLNVRFSWEFSPLSYLYVIFNTNSLLTGESRTDSDIAIFKATYLKQF